MSNNYSFPYKWSLSSGSPKMDAMLQAIIDEDVERLRYLRSAGMSLYNSDESTLRMILFEKMSASEIMKVLIEEEFITPSLAAERVYKDAKWICFGCIGRDGWNWGLLIKACYDRQYETMDLLARYRFDQTSYYINGKEHSIEDLIFERGDLTAFRILYENGMIGRFSFDANFIDGLGDYGVYRKQREAYPNGRVARYIKEHPYPVRRSMGLDGEAFRRIDPPSYFKVGLFNRKKMIQNNELLRLNYEDRLRAQKEYWAWLQEVGKLERWKKYDEEDSRL